jgi:hypothetical protein
MVNQRSHRAIQPNFHLKKLHPTFHRTIQPKYRRKKFRPTFHPDSQLKYPNHRQKHC